MQIQTPDWVKTAIFYQIFPDRFAKGIAPQSSEPVATNLEEWESPPTLSGYKGGNLWGVIEQLDYLQDLGITALYFTPIFRATCNHRYHTQDYFQVDPLLGGHDAFQGLLEAAHRRDIKVVLDGVFNHCSRGFFCFNDVLENGPHSPWVDWFYLEDWPLSAYDGSLPANYRSWVDNRALPTFNHGNPQVREYLMTIGEYWIRLGIDGWRLDVPYEVKEPGFWQEFRDRIKAINPEAYIVGEVWTNAQNWLDGSQFDAVMNYLFTEQTLAFVAGDRLQQDTIVPSYTPYPALNANSYAESVKSLLRLYPWEIQQAQFNLIESHDTARVRTMTQGDESSVELATLLLLTFPGAPCLYYGNEVGLEGGIDPDCRRVFPQKHNWDTHVLANHRQLIHLRNTIVALSIGQYVQLFAEESVYVFARVLDASEVLIAVNIGMDSVTTTLETKGLMFPEEQVYQMRSQPNTLAYGHGSFVWKTLQSIEINLSPRSGILLTSEGV